MAKKKAMQKIKRGADGRNKSVYIDLETGSEISLKDLENYELVKNDDGNYWSSEVKPKEEDKKNEEKKSTDTTEDNQTHGSDETSLRYKGEVGNQTKKALADNENPLDNYGYRSKPKGLGIAGTAAGIIGGPAAGLAVKAVDVGLNAKNSSAVNTARKSLGLDKMGFKDTIKSALKDQKGQIADVKINDEDYSVGFEALSPQGRTNLTPDEARKRSNTLGGLKEIDARGKVAGATNGSFIEKLTGLEEGWAGKAIKDLFGMGEEEVAKTEEEPVSREVSLKDLTPDKFANSTQSFPQVQVQKPTELPSALAFDKEITPGVGFIGNYGPKRPNDPNEDVFSAIGQTVKDTFGEGYTVVGTSGKGEYGSHRHREGGALDFDVLDPNGNKVLDTVALDNLAVEFARNNPQGGIGFGKGYMSDGRMHLDTVGPATQWGAGNTNANMSPILNKEIDLARRGEYMPTPTPANRDATPLAHPGQVNNPVATSLDPLKSESVFSGLANNAESYAKGVISNSVRNDFPAELASKGFISRTPEQVDRIAYALAGELSAKQLENLEANDPVAKRELANMITSIENRAASKLTGGQFDKVLDPTQYNSMMTGKLDTAQENYSIYKDILGSNINSFYNGGLSPDRFDFTNYHATYVDPIWSDKMANKSETGDHMFGVLGPAQGDYSYVPTNDFNNYRDQVGYALGTMDRTGSGTFGTKQSPGYDRSSIGIDPAGYSDRSSRGTFGTSESPGIGRSSLGSDNGGGSNYSSSGPSSSSPAGGSQAAGGYTDGSRDSIGSSSRSSSPSAGGYSGSPTNDDDGSSKTPGGGF